MAAQKIGYANKQSGSLWTSSNANEVKDVVNNNADELDTTNSRVNNLSTSVSTLTQNVSALTDKAETPVVQQTNPVVSIQPNKLNVWGSMSSLTITLTSGEAGIANEYMLEFTVSGSSFSLTFTSTVRWVEEPEWEDGYTYQVSILNGLAVAAGWEAAQS